MITLFPIELRRFLPGSRKVCSTLIIILRVASYPVPSLAEIPKEKLRARQLTTVLKNKPTNMLLDYFHATAAEMSDRHQGCGSLSQWQQRREDLRRQLRHSLGNFPWQDRPAINARVRGTIDHGDHTVEKIVYESLPGLYVTALVYVPKQITARVPAVICVNGHWSEAKATPIIQQRCMSLARMGVIAFCQDVIGTGERAAFTGSPPTTYHGFYRGATPRIVDRSLLGYIMYECLQANDYLRSRSDVDPERIICTGASGGGKQSMFFAALDDRLAGSVPVCYISSYVDHMGATACVGEVPTGVLRYTDQWEILGLHAPRPLLCLAASRDVPVFLPTSARNTLKKTAERVYRLYDSEGQVRFTEFDSKHDYNQPMRERLYAHVAEYLLAQPDTQIAESADLPVESADALRCGFPTHSQTMQSLTYRRANELVSQQSVPDHRDQWEVRRNKMLRALNDILGGFPPCDNVQRTFVRKLTRPDMLLEHWIFETEAGVLVPAIYCTATHVDANQQLRPVLVVDELGKQHSVDRKLVERLVARGHAVLAIDYRGTGETAGTVPAIGYGPKVPEYNLSNYALFLGRPLMGMRVHDIRCAIDFLAERKELQMEQLAVVGRGRGALAALLAAVFDQRIRAVVAEQLLSSWVFAEEFVDIGLSTLIPRILTVGDIEHLAACIAPRRLLLLNPVDGRHRRLDNENNKRWGPFASSIFDLYEADTQLEKRNVPDAEATEIITTWLRENGGPKR